ncbi:MAG: hypothetical protein Rsou_0780 [Candidatus Ruthia sp. Asou_11_S2]|nr:hypothetical protein [Candidatus Ruthia sp. Asou_11_S2]
MVYYKEDILRLELDIKIAQALLGKGIGKFKNQKIGGVFKKLNSSNQSTIGLEFGLAFKFPYKDKTQFYTANCWRFIRFRY